MVIQMTVVARWAFRAAWGGEMFRFVDSTGSFPDCQIFEIA